MLNEVCYEAGVRDLIDQGYLSALRSKVGVSTPDLKSVKKNSGGDYIVKALAAVTNKMALVKSAVKEALGVMEREDRKAAIFFCVDVEHCLMVYRELASWGFLAPPVTGKTLRKDRDRIIGDFKNKQLRGVCCVNVLTEGFDAPHIDCIVLLRPTLSAGLFSQMVGRGLRIHEDKRDCIVLDFAGCIEEHGPIDLLGTGLKTAMAVCADCRESFSKALRSCPACGWEIPKQEVERLEAEERERKMHGDKASKRSIISMPEAHAVDSITVSRHKKPGSPDSMKVQYRCGMSVFREWVCLDHPGYAGRNAKQWWVKRFGSSRNTKKNAGVATVNSALEDLLLSQSLLDWTKTITVKRNGKYFEVIDFNQPAEGDA